MSNRTLINPINIETMIPHIFSVPQLVIECHTLTGH